MENLKLYEISEEYIAFLRDTEKYVFSAKENEIIQENTWVSFYISIIIITMFPFLPPKIPTTKL